MKYCLLVADIFYYICELSVIFCALYRFNVDVSDESYQVSWLDLVAEEEEKKEAKAKKNFKGAKDMMGGAIDPYASDDDDQLKVSFEKYILYFR